MSTRTTASSRRSRPPAPSPDTGPRPALPHERDESSGMTGGEPSESMQQAHRDLARGLQDTDRGPEMNRTYRKLKR